MPQVSKHSNRPIRVRPRVAEHDRKRIAKACRTCRERKSRCIVVQKEPGQVSCQRCLRLGVVCMFGDSPDQVQESPSHPDSISDESNASSTHIQNNLHSTSEEIKRCHSQSSPQSARLVVRNPYQTHFVGEVSNGTFVSQVRDAVVVESPTSVPDDIQSGYIQFFNTRNLDSGILWAVQRGFPPKNVANFLVQVFFHTVEANYYYMDRERFKARLDRWYDAPTTTDADPSFLCLALIVFAMGSQFAELQGPSKPRSRVNVSDDGPGMVFYLKAKLLLSDVVTQCSLESIQACFLIGLFLLPSNISDLSYVYHGIALKMAISAGLHRKITGTDLEERVMHVRNRLWWSLYTSERRLTIILDRPESVREEDIDAPLPQPFPQLDVSTSEDNLGNLQAAIEHTRIFNEVVQAGKTVGFEDEAATNPITSIRQKLREWVEKLPLRLQVDSLNTAMKSFRGAVHLHMNHNLIIIYMGRKSLLRYIQTHLRLRHEAADSACTSPSSLRAAILNNDLEGTLIQDCVSAAFKIIELINYLWQNGKLARFSFTDMNCCSTAALIIMIHEIVQQHPLYRSSMETVIRTMSFMATGCQSAKQGLRLIQQLQVVISSLSDKIGQPETGTQVSRSTTQYEEWERWLENQGPSDSSQPRPREQPLNNTMATDLMIGEQENNSGTSEAADEAGNLGYLDYFQVPAANGEVQDMFYSWPDNLDSLGLSGFEDFEFPVFQ